MPCPLYAFSPAELAEWVALHERLARTAPRRMDQNETDASDDGQPALIAELNRLVSRALGLDEREQALVHDFVHIRLALNDGKVVTAGNADDTLRVYAHHSYSVLDVYQSNGTWRIKLRNPWGKDVNANDIANGTKVATGANDGIIDMTWSSFQGYNDFDRISIS